MADTDSFSDEYVAKILAKDAERSAIKYSALGMEAFLPPKPAVNKPKPNIRFLRTIIKETDNHNAALLAKEASESKVRLASLVTKDAHTDVDVRRRQLRHITAHLTGRPSKRQRSDAEAEKSRGGDLRQNSSSEVDTTSVTPPRSGRRHYDDQKDRRKDEDDSSSRRHNRRRYRSRSCERSEVINKRREHRSRKRSRSCSPKRHQGKESRHRKRSRDRKSDGSPSRTESVDDNERQYNKSKKRRKTPGNDYDEPTRETKPKKQQSSKRQKVLTDDESDPLDDIIGPRPPPKAKVRSRGRGTISAASGIDSRFSSNYDPTVDIELDPQEEQDWDQALEALRDRQKWKQQGADRLREAGFTEEEVRKWEKGSKKGEEEVRWAKRGESREWDRGKVVESDSYDRAESIIKADLNWGRLKGT